MKYHAPVEASPIQAPYQVGDYTDVLTVYNKDRIPQEFPMLSDRVTIGRVDSNDIALNDKAISRNHCVIERAEDGWWITDLGSTNGVMFGKTRIAPKQSVRWSPDSKVSLGPYKLKWQRHLQETEDDRTQIHMPKLVVDAREYAGGDSAEFVEVKLRTDRQSLAAGEAMNVELELMSMGVRAEEFQIFVEGIPAGWVNLRSDRITVRPTETEKIRFTIAIPHDEMVMRGAHDFQVAVEATGNPNLTAYDRSSFTVEDLHDFDLMVRQRTESDGAMCDVAVLNRGNAADFYSISAASSDGDLSFNARQWQLALTPTTQDHLRIMVRADSKPLIGAPRSVPFVITAVSNSGIEKSYYGNMDVQPRLTPQRLGVLCLALIALSAIVWFALSFFPSGAAAAAVEPVMTAVDALYALGGVDVAVPLSQGFG